MTHVDEVIDSLSSKFPTLKKEDNGKLRNHLAALHELTDKLIQDSPYELYEAQWALLGISQRAYELLIACLETIREGNRNAYAVCLRAGIETLCSLIWSKDAPDRLPSLVQSEGPTIGPMLNSGYQRYPDLKRQYQELSQVAHPGRNSHLLRFRSVKQAEEKGIIWPLTLGFEPHQADERVSEVIVLAERLRIEFEDLLLNMPTVICKGKVMAKLEKSSVVVH